MKTFIFLKITDAYETAYLTVISDSMYIHPHTLCLGILKNADFFTFFDLTIFCDTTACFFSLPDNHARQTRTKSLLLNRFRQNV